MVKASLKYLSFLLLLFSLCCSVCASNPKPPAGARYSDAKGYFEISIPPNGWQLLSWKDMDFVLWDQATGATIVVDVNPLKQGEDLANLTRHLLIAFERKQIISQDIEQVQGREALKTVLGAWAEGTEIKAEVYVVRGEGLRYDIIFWAPREVFPHKVQAFRQFLRGITLLQP
jgi:hypothetical protein